MNPKINLSSEFEKALEESILTRDTGKLVRLLEDQKDKKIIIDLAYLPTKELSMDQWLYYFSTLNLCIINSKNNEIKR